MKISAEKKKQLLLDSFDLLKDNYLENRVALHDIIEKMAKIDIKVSIDMWKCLIKENPEILHTTEDFASWIMFPIEEIIGAAKLAKIISEDDFLKTSIYGNCGDIKYDPLWILRLLISQNKLDVANELMNLILSNKNKRNSLYDVIDGAIPSSNDQITDEALELLTSWIEMIPEKTERTKLNLRILDFMDEDSADDE